ncbi:MAG: HEPN domain-containing protein [Myxococcales bacterium]|nr:MAG: HEPN domain-containing protein [Myxococcales bacterium]
MKAVLTFNGVEYPRTHNLGWLLDALKEQQLSLPPAADDLSILTPFGVLYRYDDAGLDNESDLSLDSAWALKRIKRVIVWATSQIEK